jgi:hypothetical protein
MNQSIENASRIEFKAWLYSEDSSVNPDGLTTEEIGIMFHAWRAARQSSQSEPVACYTKKYGVQMLKAGFLANLPDNTVLYAAPQQAIPSDSDLENLVTVDKRDLFDFVRGAIRDALENGLMDEQTSSEEMAMFHNATERTDKCLSKLYAKPASPTAPIERDK